jgi:NADH-quinone oxidoreductase subunit L
VQHWALGTVGLVTAVLTAFYTFRMVFLAFGGPERIPDGAHPHESGQWMVIPLALLAIGALAAGYVGVTVHAGGFAGFLEPHGAFHEFLAPVVEPYAEARDLLQASAGEAGHAGGPGAEGHLLMYVSAGLAILGIAVAYLLYVRRRDWAEAAARANPVVYDLLSHKYYIDEFNDAMIVRPLRFLGRLCHGFDRGGLDGLVWFVSMVPRVLGMGFRGLQSGAMQGYAVAMTGGLALIVLIIWMIGRGG